MSRVCQKLVNRDGNLLGRIEFLESLGIEVLEVIPTVGTEERATDCICRGYPPIVGCTPEPVIKSLGASHDERLYFTRPLDRIEWQYKSHDKKSIRISQKILNPRV